VKPDTRHTARVPLQREGAVAMLNLQAMGSGSLFGTPIMEYMWPDAAELNPQLRDTILRYARHHPGIKLSNVGGWQSESGLLEFCGSAGERLIQHILEMAQAASDRLYKENGIPPEKLDWTLNAWANVNRRGHYNNVHTHPSATWSGVYYVDSGEAKPTAANTSIHLTDPNPARNAIFFPNLPTGNFRFKPLPGLMILFPSYVPHVVPPHEGERPRISIAFNLRKEPFP
jgi:uncharacterized protein (TIGR02466 family)